MSKKDKPREVHTKDGFILEWFSRRGELEVNVYVENPDKSKGKLVSELAYPKITGVAFGEWDAEAVSIAKRELERTSVQPSTP
jgi:hypothetical protein